MKTNKILFLVLSTFIFLSPICYGHFLKFHNDSQTVLGSSFNEGWKAGWKAGWKQVNGQYSYPPFPPFPPFPNFGEDNFQGGYNAGFLAGIEAAGGLR
jgi:hypothetical protein